MYEYIWNVIKRRTCLRTTFLFLYLTKFILSELVPIILSFYIVRYELRMKLKLIYKTWPYWLSCLFTHTLTHLLPAFRRMLWNSLQLPRQAWKKKLSLEFLGILGLDSLLCNNLLETLISSHIRFTFLTKSVELFS